MTTTMLVLLAQATGDPISGGAGWVGAGLLGLVLGWLLLIHLPAKDKQIAGLIESRDNFVRELTASFRASLQEESKEWAEQFRQGRADYKASLDAVVQHCERETTAISQSLRADMAKLMDEFQKAMRFLAKESA